jgi:uracil-DNA glycosylase family 4
MRRYGVCFRFSREEQPGKWSLDRFVAAQSGLGWWRGIPHRCEGMFATRNCSPKPYEINKLTPEPAPTISQLLTFYLEAGVDCALSEEPANRLAEAERPADVKIPAASREVNSPPPLLRETRAVLSRQASEPLPTPDAAIATAREAARTAASLEILRDMLEKFDGCALKSTATRLVFADGNPKARIMFVGEAPGRDEDIEGLPFVGRSGKLLDRMIASIGLDRTRVYIANVIPWRPPGNRTPTPQETQICLPFIQRQIELVDPDILVTLGNPSTQTLLSTREGIMKTRGRWFNYDTGTRAIPAMATFHPAYLLRSPSYKRLSWQDLRTIAKALA